MRAKVEDSLRALNCQLAGSFRPSWKRKLSVSTSLSARLFRDGFHALAVLPTGDLVAAVPGAIITLRANESEFPSTHKIIRGTRPLHITSVPDGTVFWGEYFDNSSRDEVHIYASTDSGATWSIAYTFPKNESKDPKYLDAARRAFEHPIHQGGVAFTDASGDLWFEEYIVCPPTHILNGFIWAAKPVERPQQVSSAPYRA